nr:Nuclear pore complex protein NUP85 [Ipomoea batatas]
MIPKYWEVLSSALAVGWLDIVTENKLVEAVAVLYKKCQIPQNAYYSASKETGRMLPSKHGKDGDKKHVQSCLEVQDKTNFQFPKLMNLVLGIFGENTEVVAEWSRFVLVLEVR